MNESVQTQQRKAPHAVKHADSTKKRISETMKKRYARLKEIESFFNKINSPEYSRMLEKRYMQLERQLQEDIKRVNSTSKNMMAVLKLLPQFQQDEHIQNIVPTNSERFIEEVTRKAMDNFKKIIENKYTIENEQDKDSAK